ncbi:proline/betaine transporter [Anaplasma platys]|uniref:Proline/betaine transporter n=1 Tax=Anaplasma platys TaxID=949 RepID=A0A858PXB1_9RICK|nr:MFS transporter [Anaplasma platys]QJC27208.1 proline/betaine transporter [Anaplasma platys]
MEAGKVRRAVLSTIVCNTLVWYDFILFGSLAGTIGELFFPPNDRYSTLLSSFCVVAVGFCMRPFGASMFGHIGDRYGRRAALVISLIAMTVPIGFMSIIPTYSSVGMLAPTLLVICRLVQGFSLGGEAGNATFLIEHSKKNRAGLFGSFEVLSAVAGSVLSLAVVMLSRHLTGDAFSSWGWRIPFIVGFLLGIGSIFIRFKAGESPAYEKHSSVADGLVKSPVRHLFRYYKRPLLLAICIDCIENCSFHLFMVFFSSYVGHLPHSSNISPMSSELIEIVIVTLSGVLTVAFGALSDVLGRKTVMGAASATLLVVAIPVFWMLSQDSIPFIVAGYLIFVVPFAASLGPSSAAMSELFPTRVRYTGFGISRNVSSALGGGIAPALCTWLIQATGWNLAPGLCVIFWAAVALIALSRIKPSDLNVDWVKSS